MEEIIVHIKGDTIRHVYDELLDLSDLGRVSITRASNVEPTPEGQWMADLRPFGGQDAPVLGPYQKRSQALAAERTWLEEHIEYGQT